MNQIHHPKKLVEEAQKALLSLDALLQEENLAIRENKFEKIGELLESKQNMASNMQRLVAAVQQNSQVIKSNPESRGLLPDLESSWLSYEDSMRKNENLLRAAHEGTTNFLDCVRSAVQKSRPAAKTYGKAGQVEEKAQATSCMINTSI